MLQTRISKKVLEKSMEESLDKFLEDFGLTQKICGTIRENYLTEELSQVPNFKTLNRYQPYYCERK